MLSFISGQYRNGFAGSHSKYILSFEILSYILHSGWEMNWLSAALVVRHFSFSHIGENVVLLIFISLMTRNVEPLHRLIYDLFLFVKSVFKCVANFYWILCPINNELWCFYVFQMQPFDMFLCFKMTFPIIRCAFPFSKICLLKKKCLYHLQNYFYR